MAMTLRLTDDESEALRRRAQHEGRSMQAVARAAVREYIDRASRRELLDEVLDQELPVTPRRCGAWASDLLPSRPGWWEDSGGSTRR